MPAFRVYGHIYSCRVLQNSKTCPSHWWCSRKCCYRHKLEHVSYWNINAWLNVWEVALAVVKNGCAQRAARSNPQVAHSTAPGAMAIWISLLVVVMSMLSPITGAINDEYSIDNAPGNQYSRVIWSLTSWLDAFARAPAVRRRSRWCKVILCHTQSPLYRVYTMCTCNQ